jgi:phosphatidate cytidylyltransferase
MKHMTTKINEPSPSQAAAEPRQPSNMTRRIITGVTLMPFVLLLVYLGGTWFATLAVGLAAVGLLEFYALGRNRGIQGSGWAGIPTMIALVAAFAFHQPALWLVALPLGALAAWLIEQFRARAAGSLPLARMAITVLGVLYIAFPAGFLVAIRNLPDGLVWLLVVLGITWGTDSVAYFGGRLWGKTKLAPQISPKKTLEGAVAGYVGGIALPLAILLVAGALEGNLFARFSPALLLLMAVAPLVAILGDLVESWLKRFFQVKDSHLSGLDIFPGHGGVLDRIDSLILVATLCYLVLPLILAR